MKLSDIKEVEIDRDALGKQRKFILINVSSGNESKTMLVCLNFDYHQEIFDVIKERFERMYFEVEPRGGGWLFVDANSKTVWIWGRSTVFGEFNPNKVKELLENNYKNYKILFNEYKE